MEVAFLDEAAALGLSKRPLPSPAGEPNKTYNPFHSPGIGGGKPRRAPSEVGLEMKPAGATVMMGSEETKHNYEEEEDLGRESEAADVEFGMNNNKNVSSQARQSTRNAAASLPLWRRIETPPPDLARTMSQSSERHRSESSGSSAEASRSSRSSVISKVLMGALTQASEVAKTFFASTQFKEFRFKDFCPKLFGKVRELSGIDNEQYAQFFEKTCKEKFSEGRSGAFMFFSSNERFIVKTTTKSESLALHGIMPQYVQHLKANPNSLVCRFLGAHCITMYGNELYFVVMLNVFPTFPLSERYDLKGSWVNRHGFEYSRKSKRERMRREPTDSSPLYQDNDLQHKINLELDVTYSLASQIRRDVLFLRGGEDYMRCILSRRVIVTTYSPCACHRNATDGLLPVDRRPSRALQSAGQHDKLIRLARPGPRLPRVSHARHRVRAEF
jgi:hypothetical protein